MALLGINVDHVATIRQARMGVEPDPVTAALLAEQAGADQITVHLREDRRHIQIRDVKVMRQTLQTKLNLEMAATQEMVTIAKTIMPDTVTLVPEKREELTTEGGLNMQIDGLREIIETLKAAGIEVSVFIEPDIDMIRLAGKFAADAVEIHTGTYANLKERSAVEAELKRIDKAARSVRSAEMRVVAGHGLNYRNIIPLVALNCIGEYNIGHSIVSRALFTGFASAVAEMKALVRGAG